jgi:hypothetical protein
MSSMLTVLLAAAGLAAAFFTAGFASVVLVIFAIGLIFFVTKLC